MAAKSSGTILCVGRDVSLLKVQCELFNRKGYDATPALSLAGGEEALAKQKFDLVVLDFTLNMTERKVLTDTTKEVSEETMVLILHASGMRDNPLADAAVDSRNGVEAVLQAVQHLFMQRLVRAHKHPEVQGEYVVYVDNSRHYIEVTEGVCRLLGYARAELIGRTIDEISYPNNEQTEELFRRFLADGSLEGEYVLRHRSGKPVRVRYVSRAYEDGCLVARWEPVESSQSANPAGV
jgi:PAS domain S-box-containing protein